MLEARRQVAEDVGARAQCLALGDKLLATSTVVEIITLSETTVIKI